MHELQPCTCHGIWRLDLEKKEVGLDEGWLIGPDVMEQYSFVDLLFISTPPKLHADDPTLQCMHGLDGHACL